MRRGWGVNAVRARRIKFKRVFLMIFKEVYELNWVEVKVTGVDVW